MSEGGQTFRCDFHVHSTASDGSLRPAEVAEEAARVGLAAFALTDHDTVAGVAEAQAAGEAAGIEVWGGIELSVSRDEGREQMHVLGLGIDASTPELVARTQALRVERAQRGARIVERLQALGVALDFDRVCELAGANAAIGRPHVAQALVVEGFCKDQEDAFGKYLRRGRPAYVPREGLGPAQAIELIHASGGVACLAHPKLSTGVDAAGGLEAFIQRLVPLGLDGVEIEHPSHTSRLRRKLGRIARRFELVQCGGSDFHGANKPDVMLGRGRRNVSVGRKTYDALRERLG